MHKCCYKCLRGTERGKEKEEPAKRGSKLRASISSTAASISSLQSSIKKRVGRTTGGDLVIGKSRILPPPEKVKDKESDSLKESFHTALSRCQSSSSVLDTGPPRKFRHQSFLGVVAPQTPRDDKSFASK